MLSLNVQERTILWNRVVEAIETYTAEVAELPINQNASSTKIRSLLEPFDFTRPIDPLSAVNFAIDNLRRYHVHNAHPRYFGLFVPAPTAMGIAGDALAAAFNPALGAWSLSPIAVEIERHLIHEFGIQFGYDSLIIDGLFTTGGSEANHTAILTALQHKFPEVRTKGLRVLDAQPLLYTSSESHHSIIKAARSCGLGSESVREVRLNDEFQMDSAALAAQIAKDKSEGFAPFLVIATAGTTSAGAIDPLSKLADFAVSEGMWLHVDAAWGGAAMIVPEFRKLFDGISRCDSISVDVHKWLSIPMGAGIYLTRHPQILKQTFRTNAHYMPPDESDAETIDPYMRSMQWSRRFIGLKVFLSLAVAGWDGYATIIRHQTAIGDYLRQKLSAKGWKVINKTSLPVVCFIDANSQKGRDPSYLEAIAEKIVSSGEAWISTVRVGNSVTALRACITNFRTQASDVDVLIEVLDKEREGSAYAAP